MTPLDPSPRLKPMIGAATGLLIGAGVAIGSGIFRNPGLAAQHVQTPVWILAAWLFAGVYFTLAGLLTAELATRFPRAGGEYVFLRHAYGRFVAFFFGWGYTVFVAGGGVATMAVAFGDFTCQLLPGPDSPRLSGLFAVAVITTVTALNLGGLRAGATAQNTLTVMKIVALLAIVVAAGFVGRSFDWFAVVTSQPAATSGPVAVSGSVVGDAVSAVATAHAPLAGLALFAAVMMPIVWCYEGTTDAVKMTEETRDARRAMPRALVGAGVLVTGVYLLLNWAFLRVLTPAEMAESTVVPAEVLTRCVGAIGGKLALLLGMCIVLGGISSTIVSTVRVPFALGRDGLTFRFLGRMSPRQAPVGALLVAAAFAALFAVSGKYEQVLSIYTISTGVLFGLVNLSLLVFRIRDRRRPTGQPNHFRCPAGPAVSLFLAAVQFTIAYETAKRYPERAVYTLGVLALLAVLYLVWPRPEKAPD